MESEGEEPREREQAVSSGVVMEKLQIRAHTRCWILITLYEEGDPSMHKGKIFEKGISIIIAIVVRYKQVFFSLSSHLFCCKLLLPDLPIPSPLHTPWLFLTASARVFWHTYTRTGHKSQNFVASRPFSFLTISIRSSFHRSSILTICPRL